VEELVMSRPIHLAVAASVALFLGTPARAADDDADFVKSAASGGMLEVELGKHAAKQAKDPDVRAFGERMAADHGKANQELKSAAQRAGLALPSEMEDEHRDLLQRLSKESGIEFDKAYMDAMVKDHEHDVDAFSAQAGQGKSEIDRWAAKTLPTLQAHLTRAKTIAERVAKIEDDDEASPRSGSGNMGSDAGRALDPGVTSVPGRP
jgi:putative membrane protein